MVKTLIDSCQAAEAYLRRAKGENPPRPRQHQFAMRWPDFEAFGDIFDETGVAPKYSGLLLYGQSGTGKTTTLYSTLQASCGYWESEYRAPDIAVWNAVDLGRAISRASKSDAIDTLAEHLSYAGLLVVDDFDKARFTPRVESELFGILETRENLYLPVAITTNSVGNELEKMFSKNLGPAIVNRLRRMCVTVDFDDQGFDLDAELAEAQRRLLKSCVSS